MSASHPRLRSTLNGEKLHALMLCMTLLCPLPMTFSPSTPCYTCFTRGIRLIAFNPLLKIRFAAVLGEERIFCSYPQSIRFITRQIRESRTTFGYLRHVIVCGETSHITFLTFDTVGFRGYLFGGLQRQFHQLRGE